MSVSVKGIVVAGALAMASALCVSPIVSAQTATTSEPSEAAKRVLNKPLSAAQQKANAEQGTQFGQQGLTNAESSTLQMDEGAGPKKAGCTRLNGECVDNEQMIGRGYDQDRVDRAGQVDGKMSSLKQLHDEEAKKTTADDGVAGQAYRTTEASDDALVAGRRAIAETNWEPTREAFRQGRQGNAMGMGFEQCETSTTVIPGTNTDAYIKEQNVCEEVTLPSGGQICTRERVVTTTQPRETKTVEEYLGINGGQNATFCQRSTQLEAYQVEVKDSKTGTLGFSNETGGLVCTRNRWAQMVDTPYDKEKTASLGINTEVGGLSCSRWLEPSNSQDIQPQQMTADLPVDNQAGGNLCKRLAWPESGTTPRTGSKTGLLNVNGESGGLSCSRTVWPESSSNNVPTSHDATLNIDQQPIGGNLCRREVWPTTTSGTTPGSKTATLGVNQESGGLSCNRTILANSGTSAAPGSKDVVASVNNEAGGTSCSRWRHVQENQGSTVTTGSYTFTRPTVANRDTGPWYQVIDLTAFVPAGTSSLANFALVKTMQSQRTHTFSISDYPTAANGWRVTVMTNGFCIYEREERIDTCTNQNPGANTAYFTFNPVSANRLWSVQESGNCGDVGTPNCPAVWHCNTQAPTTINGIAVSAAEVSGLPLLYPGSPGACTASTLARTCGGTATTSNTFSIADRLPPGTTSISGFSAVIQNPQSGVAAAVIQVPHSSNNWVAIIRIDRTDYSYTPAPVQLQLSWNHSYDTNNPSVYDSGNCSDPGTAACPARWSCATYAPANTGSGWVSEAMAQSFAPLFPGAPATCAQGTLWRTCAGSPGTSTQVSIADQIPAGTTSISNFAFTVNNPQAGVTVSLVQAPSQANNWIASFNVTRTNWGAVPAGPNVTLTWNNATNSTSVSVRDTGNCAGTGTANCPVSWTCTGVAPMTINGQTVTPQMAASLAPLFPGASSSCAMAQLDKTCSGTAPVSTTVNLSGRMPAGTTSISNLAFTVLNPQSGVAVRLTQTPTAANGWVAIFVTDRTVWNAVPTQPNIRITWNSSVPSTTVSVRDTGSCSDPGSSTCPTRWTCPNRAPHTVNGIVVNAQMAGTQSPLFPGAVSDCVVGHLNRVCSGSATVGTQISIADQIPAGVNTISNFGFSVQNPQAGVTVSLVTAPSQANGWMATFNVTRSNVANPPSRPQVSMSWTMDVPSTNMSVRDTGNCAATGTANCPAVWTCPRSAPQTVNGITVTAAMAAQVAPLFAGASNSCVEASLDKSCSGSANTSPSISIASRLPAGTTAIQNFRFTVNNPQSGVAVSLTQTPALANNWVAIFRVARTDFSVAKANPNITLQWDAVIPTVTLTVRESGNCSDPGSGSCPTRWSCTSSAPTTVNGIHITAQNAATMAPLFGGAPSECVRGELNRVCTGSASVGTTVGIGELIPAGVHAIENFAFQVLNPQPGVTVTLTTAPTEANGWMAYFNVARTNWGTTPVAPQIRITFRVLVPEPRLTVQDTGNCNDPGSAACPTQWSCTQSAPTTINGIQVTEAMVRDLPQLFPNASAVCTQGQLSRVCNGTGTSTSQISIADKVPASVDAIVNFTWSVLNPQANLAITLASEPTKANGWVATFQVVRDYAAGGTPVAPEIELKWGVMETRHRAQIVTTGTCEETGGGTPPPGGGGTPPPGGGGTPPPGGGGTPPPGGGGTGPGPAPGDPGTPVIQQVVSEGESLPSRLATLALDALIPSAKAQGLPAGESCSVGWHCTQSLPATINGIPVTQDMLDERGPLYPGDGPPPSCVAADYKRVCSGTGGANTQISIKPHLRPDTKQIYNYTWTVIEPGAGVEVASVQVPALENDWVAIFTVTRTNWNVAPVAPKVKLQWEQGGEYQHEFEIIDTGDCSQGQDDEFCKVKWVCEDEAEPPPPPTEGPLLGMTDTGWINGVDAISGEPNADEINLSQYVPAGTVFIRDFGYQIRYNNQACQSRIFGEPTPDQPRVTMHTEATQWGVRCSPEVRFTWANHAAVPPPNGQASLNATQVFLKGVALVGNALLPKAMAAACADCPAEGGGGVDAGDLVDQPPLFPGDGPPATCMRARKELDCTATYVGRDCTTNSEGEEVCVDQPPTDRPDTCAEYRDDPQCQLVREECAEGGMSTTGWCYVKSRLYECKRPVPGGGAPNPIIRRETTCSKPSGQGVTLPAVCHDGSCSNAQTTEQEVGMGQSGAKMMVIQHVMNDYKLVGGGAPPGGGGGNPGDPGGPIVIQQQIAKAEKSTAEKFGDALLAAAGIGTAYAQTAPDPWGVPDGEEGNDEGAPAGMGGLNSTNFAAMNNIKFFSGQKRDCMKALGGLLNCCKKTPPQDQAPKLWEHIKKNLTQANNAKGREDEADSGPSGFLSLIQGASHADLMKKFTSTLDSLKGGGDGGDTNTDATIGKAYKDFFNYEKTEVKPKLAWYCDNDEFELAVGKQTGTCTHLGSFCQTRVLGSCIIKKDRYCCFNSPVTRIIRESMDETGIADLGTAKNPQCDGVSMEQVSRMNPDDVDMNEVEGRMAQGMFNIDIAALQNMSFDDIQRMMDGSLSMIGDPTRQNPSDRNADYVGQTDPSGAYGSIMGSQQGYRPPTTPVEATAGEIGLSVLERDYGRGVVVPLNVRRTGSKGAVTVRIWTEPGTAIAPTHYQHIDQTLSWADGETGEKKAVVRTVVLTAAQKPVPRQSFKVNISIVSGDAKLTGNSTATIWLLEEK